jgi:hypothetical protein
VGRQATRLAVIAGTVKEESAMVNEDMGIILLQTTVAILSLALALFSVYLTGYWI